MKNIFWTGYTNDERHTAIDRVQSIVSRYGHLVDVKLFSDISLTMTIEVEQSRVQNLYSELKTNIAMDKVEDDSVSSKGERTIYLNVSFIKGTGDLRIKVPAVPG